MASQIFHMMTMNMIDMLNCIIHSKSGYADQDEASQPWTCTEVGNSLFASFATNLI